MGNKSQRLQLKFTIELSIFFLVLSATIYTYVINSFEADALEKYIYKSRIFLNFFEQNPEIFRTSEITDKNSISNLVNLNDALYLVLEDNNHNIIGAVNIEGAEKSLYILAGQSSGISSDNNVFKVFLPVFANSREVGNIYVGFDAAETIVSLHKTKLLTAIFSLSILLIGIIITYFLSTLSFKPLTKLISTLDKIIKGDKEIKIEYTQNNEIGILAEKINSVLTELDKSSSHVKSLNVKLSSAFKKKIFELDNEISHRKKAELSLRKSEEQFGLVFENAPIGMFIVSLENKIIGVNKSFCDLTGFYKEEIIGAHVKMLFDSDLRKASQESPNQKNINYYDLNSEKIVVKKDYDQINVIIKSVIIYDHRSVPKHTIVQLLDITEIKKVHKELTLALEKAEESNRLKSAFLAQMSHEIRTPLNVILASVPLLADELSEKNNDVLTIIGSVDSAGKRLQRTIDMILNMSAVQTGNYLPEFELINIEVELQKLVREFKSLSDEKGLSLNLKCFLINPYIYADPYTVIQIFQNLIGNSIKYTHKGSVNITIEDDKNEIITILIQDTGIGMSHEYLEHLFSPFSQEDAGQKRQYEGNGLGLALVKKYIEINNADIIVNSEKNIGSVFKVIFKKYLVSNSNVRINEKINQN